MNTIPIFHQKKRSGGIETPPDTINPVIGTLSLGAITGSTVVLNWTAGTDNVAVTRYDVYKDDVFLITLGAVLTYTATGLDDATEYDFKVKAFDAELNESAFSNTVSPTTLDTTNPSDVTGLAKGTVTNDAIPLSWNAASDNVGVTGYEIWESVDGGGYSLKTTLGAVTSYANTGLTENTLYAYQVKAKDAAGNTSTNYSGIVTDTTLYDDQSAPTLSSVTIEDADPTDVVMVFSEAVDGTNLGFTIGGTTSTTFASISGSGTTWTGVLADAVENGETVTLSYASGTGDFEDDSENALASITDRAVTNNVSASKPSNEIFPDGNSASPYSEANSVAAFDSVLSANIESVSVDPYDGTYNVKVTGAGQFSRLEYLPTLIVGNTYRISFWYRSSVYTGEQRLDYWEGFTTQVDVELTSTTWAFVTMDLEAEDTDGIMRFYPYNHSSGLAGVLEIDKLSILDLGVV